MGAYLTGGIATRVTIMGKDGFDIIKNKGEVFETINDVIDTTSYEVVEYENGFELLLKKEIFNNNIHDLIREVYSFIDVDFFFFTNLFKTDTKISMENFTKENYPIELKVYSDGYRKGEFYLNNEELRESKSYLNYAHRFLPDNNISYKLNIKLSFIDFWLDPSKVNEYPLGTIDLLNKIVRVHFKNKLVKSIFFYVE